MHSLKIMNIETNHKTILYTAIFFVAHFYDNQHIFRNTNYLNISFLWYDFLSIVKLKNTGLYTFDIKYFIKVLV